MIEKEICFAIALTKTPGVGSITARTLLSYCGSFEAIFNEKKKDLLKIPGIGLSAVEAIQQTQPESLYHSETEFIEKHEISAFHCLDQKYPRRLKNCPDAPIVVYFKGNTDLNHPRTISIVGTRKPSEFGIIQTEKIVQELARFNVQIISGLAYGIDATVHQSCIREKISTLGVLGHGLDRIYPFIHRNLAREMQKMGGIVTEFPINTKPDREHFPMRNRIIAGLSDAVLVIESAESGGSMITAMLGNDYNRDVFALPGRNIDPKSKGCNKLIKKNLAQLIEHAQDISEMMNWDQLDEKRIIQPDLFKELEPEEQKIVDKLNHSGTLAIDEVQYIIRKSSSDTARILLQMEFKGIVKSLPGKRFALI